MTVEWDNIKKGFLQLPTPEPLVEAAIFDAKNWKAQMEEHEEVTHEMVHSFVQGFVTAALRSTF